MPQRPNKPPIVRQTNMILIKPLHEGTTTRSIYNLRKLLPIATTISIVCFPRFARHRQVAFFNFLEADWLAKMKIEKRMNRAVQRRTRGYGGISAIVDNLGCRVSNGMTVWRTVLNMKSNIVILNTHQILRSRMPRLLVRLTNLNNTT